MKKKPTFDSYRKSTFGLNPSQNPAANPGMGFKSKAKGGTYTQNSKGKHPRVKMVGRVTNEDLGRA